MPTYHPKKRLGQHFLKSQVVIDKIIALVAPGAGDTIVEIGPGRGALTVPLASAGAAVVAVEFDRDVMGYLTRLLRGRPLVRLVNQDFLSFDPAAEGIARFKLVGNLPYNITAPVVDWAVAHRPSIQSAVLMMQREVADRVCAVPTTKAWSPLSVFTQVAFRCEHCFDVSPKHFRPTPNVASSVIRLTPKRPPVSDRRDLFERVVRCSFRHRRKLLVNNLAGDLLPDGATVRTVLERTGLERNCRAEQLSIADFLNLTDTIAEHTMR